MKKKLLFIILSIFTIPLTYSQVMPSSCEASDSLYNIYGKYAAQIAINRFYEFQSPDTSFIKVKDINIDSVFSAIISIYNLKNSPVRDTVFNMHNVSVSHYGIHEVIVSVDSTKSWVNNWKKGINLTGDKRIDSLLTKYNLKLKRYQNVGYAAYAILTSDLYLNIKALSLALETHQDVRFAESNSWHINGADIYYKVENDARYLVFYAGTGDCPSGCMRGKYWSFKIYANCSVEYLGTSNKFPPFNTTNQDDVNKGEIHVFPNPTHDYITIQANNIKKIEVFNTLGQNVNIPNAYYFNVGKVKLDLSRLSSGIYFFKVSTMHNSEIKKVLLK